jgi:hypothetical protein
MIEMVVNCSQVDRNAVEDIVGVEYAIMNHICYMLVLKLDKLLVVQNEEIVGMDGMEDANDDDNSFYVGDEFV